MHKVVVIGLGSMGRRRIRLMQTLDAKPAIVGVDLAEARREQSRKEFGIDVFPSLDEAIAAFAPDAALVCASPASHGPIVLQCLERGLDVFMEINLISDWYDEATALAERKGLKVFVSSTFLYHPQLEHVIDVCRGEKVNYIYHSGQYLPDWHPWENYKDFFVSKKRTNACREILAIEFPWMIQAFGDVVSVDVMKDKMSSLDLDFPDNYMISLQHLDGTKGIFCQDVISRKGMRSLEVYSENLHLFWDGRSHDLNVFKGPNSGFPAHLEIFEDVYRRETEAFLDYLDGRAEPRHSLAADRKVLALIDRIEGGG